MNIQEEIRQIQERNKKVASDKAWERSLARRVCVMAVTFLGAFTFLLSTQPHMPRGIMVVSSTIPCGAYFLSTLTFPFFRKYWETWK